mmetsp:Transcript_52476/g.122083  ORF Transcript_52476/g.122083 Transcript_52476/m.122083 type:complete len:100 (+) Transcript_52476:3-302(+)
MSFQARIKPERAPEPEVVIDFSGGKVLDHSGLDAITKVVDRLHSAGKKVHCRSLPQDARIYLSLMSEATLQDDRAPAKAPPSPKAAAEGLLKAALEETS